MRFAVLLLAAASINACTSQAYADEPASSQPATSQPAASQPAASPPVDPVDGLLNRIEQRAADIKTLQARIRYDRIQILQGDEQRRFGALVYSAGPPARFDLRFDRLLADGVPRRIDRRYIFDGVSFVERDNLEKQFTKRQVVAPGADPKDNDMLALGNGPFALPINADPKRIRQRFHVAVVESTDGDEADADQMPDTHHLRFTPKEHVDIEYDQLDVWYRKADLIPVRGVSRHAGSGNEDQFTLLGEIQVNGELADDFFDTTAPAGADWHVEIKPWEDR